MATAEYISVRRASQKFKMPRRRIDAMIRAGQLDSVCVRMGRRKYLNTELFARALDAAAIPEPKGN